MSPFDDQHLPSDITLFVLERTGSFLTVESSTFSFGKFGTREGFSARLLPDFSVHHASFAGPNFDRLDSSSSLGNLDWSGSDICACFLGGGGGGEGDEVSTALQWASGG